MSKLPRLPSLVCRYIDEIFMSGSSTAPQITDPDLPASLDQSQLISPFRCLFKGPAISDGFYSIPAKSQVNLPTECILLITDWSLVLDSGLNLIIKKAEVLSDSLLERKIPETPIEHNYLVNESLRKYRFLLIKRQLEENVVQDNEDSVKFLQNLEKMNKELLKEEKSEDRVNEGDFVRESYFFAPALESIAKDKNIITLSYDLGIDEFPTYALEYLKHKYNVV